MPVLSNTPDDVTIAPRNRDYAVSEALRGDWFDNHAFKTAWFNAMSITFPLGEKFFIDSVRHFLPEIDDPKLIKEIKGFCGQEGFHRREHQRYNEALCEQRGYDLAYLDGRMQKGIDMAYKYNDALERLAATAAFEHITAILAEMALAPDNPMLGVVEDPMKALWDWHAAEEMEHKSVAFDVFKAVGGSERLRKRAMLEATFFLLVDILMGVIHMLRKDGKLWRPKLWWEGWKFLFFKDGIIRKIWPAYKEYYRDNFHPWQRDTRPLLTAWKLAQANP